MQSVDLVLLLVGPYQYALAVLHTIIAPFDLCRWWSGRIGRWAILRPW